eukprot:scaffold20968_cov120-Skeletonema_marinoi.AAC.1
MVGTPLWCLITVDNHLGRMIITRGGCVGMSAARKSSPLNMPVSIQRKTNPPPDRHPATRQANQEVTTSLRDEAVVAMYYYTK